MAVDADRARTSFLVCLNTSSLDRGAAMSRCVEASCSTAGRAEAPAQRALDAGYSGRIPRFAYFTRVRRGTAAPTASPHDLATPIPPVTDRSIEERTVSWTDSRTSWLQRLRDAWIR